MWVRVFFAACVVVIFEALSHWVGIVEGVNEDGLIAGIDEPVGRTAKSEPGIGAHWSVALDPQAVWAGQNLALCLEKLGRRDEAITELKRTLAIRLVGQ